MSAAFADTSYFLALLNTGDHHHERARELASGITGPMITTAWVLTELYDA